MRISWLYPIPTAMSPSFEWVKMLMEWVRPQAFYALSVPPCATSCDTPRFSFYVTFIAARLVLFADLLSPMRLGTQDSCFGTGSLALQSDTMLLLQPLSLPGWCTVALQMYTFHEFTAKIERLSNPICLIHGFEQPKQALFAVDSMPRSYSFDARKGMLL